VTSTDPGGWYCAACHSLNRPRSTACYSCGLPAPARPAEAAAEERPAGRHAPGAPRGLAALAVVAIVGLGLVGAVTAASLLGGGPGTTASPIAEVANASATETLEPTESVEPTPTPTTRPTVRATPTPTPTPAPTPAPTARPSGLVPLPDFPVSIPGVTIGTYSVSGSAEWQLAKSMIANAKGSCDGEAIGCLRDSFTWHYTTEVVSGTCHVTDVTIDATYIVILPRWDGPNLVPERLIPWFQKTLDNLVDHLNDHLDVARSYVPDLKAAILAGSCDATAVRQTAERLMSKVQARQDALDEQDLGYPWPTFLPVIPS
jgi:predicted secreted Zn-dependent protease